MEVPTNYLADLCAEDPDVITETIVDRLNHHSMIYFGQFNAPYPLAHRELICSAAWESTG